ncbi:MAG: class I SAM-dependent RNA methyltransferase [Myxococcota bacterium]|nr:class I SAM-dependent RNA methyltransferase [Myxococcota bacterium]
MLECFATITPGLEAIAQAELEDLGLEGLVATEGGFEFQADIESLVALNLWSRTASRFLVRLGQFTTRKLGELEARAAKLPWRHYLDGKHPIRLRASCKRSKIYHTGAVIERVARSIESVVGTSITLVKGESDESQEQLVLVRIMDDLVVISIDTSGAHLHKRGYRQAVAKAPLREHLAAAFILMTGWDGSTPFYDPMTGSGTLPIEAALWAANQAPGLTRSFAMERWPCVPPKLITRARSDAKASLNTGHLPPILGFDRNPGAIQAAQSNAERAGLPSLTFDQAPLSASAQIISDEPGLMLVNPPYGLRIGEATKLRNLYDSLGKCVNGPLAHWEVGVISANRDLLKRLPPDLSALGAPVFHGGTRIYFHVRKA